MSSDDAVKSEVPDEGGTVVVPGTLVPRPSTALAAAVQRAGEYGRQTRSPSTERAYKGDWERFTAWAASVGGVPLPAAPELVCAHLAYLADKGCGVATIERFLAAAGYYHRAAGHDFVRGARIVSTTLEGIRRRVGTKRTKKAPMGIRALADACARLGEAALRDRAMLTVGWFAMLRSANLVRVRREHIRLIRFDGGDHEMGRLPGWIDDEEHPQGLILHLPESKTDQRKAGRDVAVHAQEDETVCPVRTLSTYLRANRFAPEDLIFPVCERTVSRLIKRLAANPEHGHKSLREIAGCVACASAARRFASHSLRRGAATEQARQGVPEREIMRQGGWKDERVVRGYIEDATLFQDNPTKNLAKKPGGAA